MIKSEQILAVMMKSGHVVYPRLRLFLEYDGEVKGEESK